MFQFWNAPVAVESQSHIKINFGGQINNNYYLPSNPLDLSFLLQFFSQEQRIKRKQFEATLKAQLPSSVVIIQFTMRGKNGAQLEQVFKKSGQKNLIKIARDNNKMILAFTGNLCQAVEKQSKQYSSMQRQFKKSDKIKLDIKSNNNISEITKIIKEKGSILYGILTSLQISFKFSKSPFTQKTICKILEEGLGIKDKSHLIKSFKKIKLSLNCAKPALLDIIHPDFFQPMPSKQTSNEMGKALIQAKIQSANIYILNPVIFLKGNLQLTDLSLFISLISD